MIWHTADETPREREHILVIFVEDGKKFYRRSAIGMRYFQFAGEHESVVSDAEGFGVWRRDLVEKWAYLNELEDIDSLKKRIIELEGILQKIADKANGEYESICSSTTTERCFCCEETRKIAEEALKQEKKAGSK